MPIVLLGKYFTVVTQNLFLQALYRLKKIKVRKQCLRCMDTRISKLNYCQFSKIIDLFEKYLNN